MKQKSIKAKKPKMRLSVCRFKERYCASAGSRVSGETDFRPGQIRQPRAACPTSLVVIEFQLPWPERPARGLGWLQSVWGNPATFMAQYCLSLEMATLLPCLIRQPAAVNNREFPYPGNVGPSKEPVVINALRQMGPKGPHPTVWCRPRAISRKKHYAWSEGRCL